MRPVILLTRPAPDCADTARQLAERTGLRVVQSPLIALIPADALPDLSGASTLIFTSRNGVRTYAALGGPPMPAVCVGQATADAARAIGCDARAMGGDAEALVAALLDDPRGAPFLHLRGTAARGDIAARLAAAGIAAGEAVIYDQPLHDLTDEARALLDGSAPVIVPLYSPRTAARFAACANGSAPLHLVSISAGADLAAGKLQPISRRIADTPDADAMRRAIDATVGQVEGT